MSVPMKARPTRGVIKVVVGERNPQSFLVPKKAAEGVVELLRPYASDEDAGAVSANEVFAKHYAAHGKAGTVLKGFRAREEMTQQQLARRLGVTQGDVSAMEHGRRPIGKAMASRLAKVFNTEYRVFL